MRLGIILPLILSLLVFNDSIAQVTSSPGGVSYIPGGGGGGSGTLTSITPQAGITNTPGSTGTAITTSGSLYAQSLPHTYTSSQNPIPATDAAGIDAFEPANGTDTGTFTIPQAGTTGFESGVSYAFVNGSIGSLTLSTTTSTFKDCPVTGSSIVLSQYGNVVLTSDGTNYKCQSSSVASTGTPSSPNTVPLVTSTYTPNFNTSRNFNFYLVHTTCAPCTIANPSTALVPGQQGELVVTQSATGTDTVSWGSDYVFPGATAPTLTTGASKSDLFPYYVDASGLIVVGNQIPNVANLAISNTLAIDGSATLSIAAGTVTNTLSNTNTNDVIVAQIFVNATTGTPTISSVSDTLGLTWNKRTLPSGCKYTDTTPETNDIEEYWAFSSGKLTSDVISVTQTGGSGTLSMRLTTASINGANTTTPFDPNVSLPACTNTTALGTPTAASLSQTVSGTKAKTIFLGFLRNTGVGSGFATVTRPSGFTQIIASGSFADSSSQIFSSAQTSLALQYSWSNTTGQTSVGYLMDAIQAAGQ